MGYDFTLGCFTFPENVVFPCNDLEEMKQGVSIPRITFENYVRIAGGQPNGSSNSWMIDHGDDNVLYLDYSSGGVHLDVHCDWLYVLRLLEFVRSDYPDALLFDLQTSAVHDPESFKAFMYDNGMGKDER